MMSQWFRPAPVYPSWTPERDAAWAKEMHSLLDTISLPPTEEQAGWKAWFSAWPVPLPWPL